MYRPYTSLFKKYDDENNNIFAMNIHSLFTGISFLKPLFNFIRFVSRFISRKIIIITDFTPRSFIYIGPEN